MVDAVRRKKWTEIELIGQRIREARERLDMSRDDLASILGKSVDMVSRYERGNRAVSITELPKLAHALQVPIGYFFGDEEPTTEALAFISSEVEALPRFKQKAVLDRIRFELEWWKSHAPDSEEPSPDNIPVA